MAMLIQSAELTEKDENGFQRVILWDNEGVALLVLEAKQWAPGLDGAGREAVMCDLLDVLQDGLANGDEIERLRAALQEVATVLYDARRAYHNSEQWRDEGPDGCDGPSFDDLFREAFAKGGVTP